MSPNPHTIAHDQSLATAHRLMRAYGVRHLPVLSGGRLEGIVSQRDLYLLESLADVDLEDVPVREAMTSEVEVFDPGTPLSEVVARMAALRCGSAIVLAAGKVAGIFTTTDALRALASLLGEENHSPRQPRAAAGRLR